MAKKPGSTIPVGTPTPQYPTSAYSVATTYLPQATVQMTLSASETYSVISIENTVSIAWLGCVTIDSVLLFSKLANLG